MRTSEKIGELVKALAAAKKSIKAPKKGRTGKVSGTSKKSGRDYEYEYSYADRADVIEAYREPLASNDLVILHAVGLKDGTLVLTSRLAHSSGEWVESDLPIPAETARDAQVLGGFLTYFERYNSCALVDVAAEDDDDGKRAVAPKQEEAPVDPQSLPFYDLRLAIKDAGEELEQRGGGLWPEHVRKASAFTDKSGKAVSGFPDPFNPKVKSEAWLKSTLGKLTAALAESEPGAEEGAAALT